MPIVRDESGKRKYSNISTAHVRDKRLSLKAIGLMTIMLTLPDTWKFSIEGLATLTSDKVDSVKSGLIELERFGYIERERIRDKGKIKEIVYTLYELPKVEKPLVEKPLVEKPLVEKPREEKQPQSNNSIKYELNKVIIEKISKRETPENKKPKAYKKSNYEEWKEVYEKLNEQQNKESESETVWQN